MGCVTEKEVVYRKVYFAETNGVTTIYYQIPNDDARWMYVASKDAPDDGTAKVMKPEVAKIPFDIDLQQQWSDEYHNEHPECSYGYYR